MDKSIYAQAIQIYVDYGKKEKGLGDLLIEILKSNPSVIVKADRTLNKINPYSRLNSLDAEALCIVRDGRGKIPAIKLIRASLGLGLKEAKDHIEKLMADNPI